MKTLKRATGIILALTILISAFSLSVLQASAAAAYTVSLSVKTEYLWNEYSYVSAQFYPFDVVKSNELECVLIVKNESKKVIAASYRQIVTASSIDFYLYENLGKYYVSVQAKYKGVTVTSNEVVLNIVDKNELDELTYEAYDVRENRVTPESWEALQTALANAEKLLDKTGVTQKELDAAYDALSAALDNLEPKYTGFNAFIIKIVDWYGTFLYNYFPGLYYILYGESSIFI